MDRRAFLVAAGTAGTVSVSGCLDGGLSEDDYDIGMSANAFLPDEYEVSVGDTVVWGNNGSRGHTVTASGLPEGAGYFASGGYEDFETAESEWHATGGGNIAPGETFEHTFEVPGEYEYICIPHVRSDMVGDIYVSE